MALDGIVLHQINTNLQDSLPAKINKIQQISNDEIMFVLRSQARNQKLMISCHSTYNRIHFTNKEYQSVEIPSNFVMLLRKHIDRSIITSIEQAGLDRVLKMTLLVKDELGDDHEYYIYVELMGKYANLILVNEANHIVDALKRIPAFEDNARMIHPGALYSLPIPHHKKDPFTDFDVNENDSLVTQFHGFSPLLSDEVLYRLKQGENFKEIMRFIKDSQTIYISTVNDVMQYHVLPLTHIKSDVKEFSISEGMDYIFYGKEEKVRIKQQSGDISKTIKQELKKNKKKLIKLQQTLDDANNLDTYRLYGDLLYAYPEHYEKHAKSIEVYNYEDDTQLIIPLDDKISVKRNAKKYYQKYNKSKTAQIEVQKQIDITLQAIAYFENVETQLLDANLEDAMEIKEELANKGYMKRSIQRIRKKKKDQKPHFLSLMIDDVMIYVGKNNIQNDYITFKQAHRDDTWLHVKDLHGSHVVIHSENPNELQLRSAAMLAAYYSQGKQSSSVPVNYCLVRNVKKPNSASLGFINIVGSYKTIYIDPNEDEILKLINTYQVKEKK